MVTGSCRGCGRSGWMSYLVYGSFTYDISTQSGICGRCDAIRAKKLAAVPPPIIFKGLK